MVKNQDNLAFESAHELGKLIQRKEISPLELTELYIERISEIDQKIGAFVHFAPEVAIKDAHIKTEILGNTKDTSELPLFFGIPTAIKDLYQVKGMPTGYGNNFIKDQIADFDTGFVSKIKQAGMIILGKTATSELGSLPYTESVGLPPSRNPHNFDYTSGGSSGGAAAAVAAGLIPVVCGSDGGGSVRGPAFCCGLVGLKPARGRVSNAPVGDYFGGIATHGCISRTVTDSAILLDILSGYIIGDPYWLPNPQQTFFEATLKEPSSLKIAYAMGVLPDTEADLSLQQQVKETAETFAQMGHTVIEVDPDFSALIEPFTLVWQSAVSQGSFPAEILNPMNRWLKDTAPSLGEYLRAIHQMQIVSREIVAFFADFDVLLLPTYLQPPIKVGEWAGLSASECLDSIRNWISPCPPFNATGQSAIALPTGFSEDGLPIGVQLVGQPHDEISILQLAHQLEQVKQWQQYRPPLLS